MLEYNDSYPDEYYKAVKMEVTDVSQGMPGSNRYFVILTEQDGELNRRLSVMVGAAEAQAILVRLRKVDAPRPTMPDLFVRTLTEMCVFVEEVYIDRVEDGVYHSCITFHNTSTEKRYTIDSRLSDALALALRFDAPVYCSGKVLCEEHFREQGNGIISVPITSVGLSVLREALERAVGEENFEMAARLRDEIARRELSGQSGEDN